MSTALIVVAMVAILGLAVVMIINGNKPKSEQAKAQKELYRKGYKFLSRNFITQGSIRKIYSKLSNLCVYKREELYVLTLQYWAMSWGVSAALIGFAVFVFNSNESSEIITPLFPAKSVADNWNLYFPS